jgi:hypothetical protein
MKNTKKGCEFAARIIAAMLTISVFAGTVAAGPPIYKNNVMTAQHVVIPGTHVAVIPPSGAKPQSSFNGFEIQSRSIRLEAIERRIPFNQAYGTITPEGLEADGVKAEDISDVNLNGKPAKLVSGTMTVKENDRADNAGDIRVILMILGNENVTLYLYGYYPGTDKTAEGLLRNSMLSAILEPKQKENASGAYSITTAGTSFKFQDEVAGTRYYSINDNQAKASSGDAVYTVSSQNQTVQAPDRESFAHEAAARYLSQFEYEIISGKNVSYGGLPGIEIIADLKSVNSRNDKTARGARVKRTLPARGYQTLLFDDSGKVYYFSGIAVRDADNYLAQFIRITSTFKLTKTN